MQRSPSAASSRWIQNPHGPPLPALGLLLPHHLPQRPPAPADLPQAAHLTARLGERHVDRLLVHVHPHKNLARLFHGPSPFSVFAPPCQTCGSARPSRNPRYRGGGPPPLEREPFCLDRYSNAPVDCPHSTDFDKRFIASESCGQMRK